MCCVRLLISNMNIDIEECDLPVLDDLKSVHQLGGVEACRSLLERKREEWNNLPLNMAVIGNTGVGKSTFINAIRRLTAEDEGAADADVTETTVDIRSYSHPNNPLLKFWDLPGVGTHEFRKNTYLAKIEVDRYDFFLLVTATRFTENDTWLGSELSKREKKYYFVYVRRLDRTFPTTRKIARQHTTRRKW